MRGIHRKRSGSCLKRALQEFHLPTNHPPPPLAENSCCDYRGEIIQRRAAEEAPATNPCPAEINEPMRRERRHMAQRQSLPGECGVKRHHFSTPIQPAAGEAENTAGEHVGPTSCQGTGVGNKGPVCRPAARSPTPPKWQVQRGKKVKVRTCA